MCCVVVDLTQTGSFSFWPKSKNICLAVLVKGLVAKIMNDLEWIFFKHRLPPFNFGIQASNVE